MPKHLFQPGQSGNPKGRPPKERALADLLAMAGGKRVMAPNGDRVQRQRIAVENIWDLLAFGRAQLLGLERPFAVNGRDYVELVKFVFNHIDGPAPTKFEHSSDPDRPLSIRVEYDDGDLGTRVGADLAATATTLLTVPNGAGGEAV